MADPVCSAPAERNKRPILDVLRGLLPERGHALEIASGTGQHVVWFAQHLPHWVWQPTDLSDELFDSVLARVREAGLSNVLHPRLLNVLRETWPLSGARYELVYCANMLHIAPWACCTGLMRGAARHLDDAGRLVTYGPYLEDETPTAEGNLAFDRSLRERNADWGLRRREDVEQEALRAGLKLAQRIVMPANNLCLVWTPARSSA